MAISFAAIKATAPSYVEAFCRRYLGSGKRVGAWWIVSTPWRVDKTPSLGINLTTATWKDFSKGDHGDLTDLLARIDHCTIAEAATRLARMMGIS